MDRYKDTFLCDIVDMDAYHVLLEPPWEFDLDVVHKGKENAYTFSKDGQKFTLCLFLCRSWPKLVIEEEDHALHLRRFLDRCKTCFDDMCCSDKRG